MVMELMAAGGSRHFPRVFGVLRFCEWLSALWILRFSTWEFLCFFPLDVAA